MLMAAPLVLTSCEDVLGHWEKPTPAVIPAAPSYYKWDATEKKLVPEQATGDVTVITPEMTTWSGTCFVDKDITIDGNVTMADDVILIIADGVKLQINGKVAGADYSLGVFGQEAGTGQFIVDAISAEENAIEVKGLEVAEVKIEAKTSTANNACSAIKPHGTTLIYAGTITAEGYHAFAGTDVEIIGGELNLTSDAQTLTGNTLTISGGKLNISGNGTGGTGLINAHDITIKSTIEEIKITNNNAGTSAAALGIWMQASNSLIFGTNTDIHTTWNESSTTIATNATYSIAGTTGFTVKRTADKDLTITPNNL